ncbi:MAG: hypothetical protein WAK96_01380 [Desulfobaccales bacterium]
MDNILKYLEIVKREEEIKAQSDKRLNEDIRDQQNKYVDLINPIMSLNYSKLLETQRSLQGGVKAENVRCEIKAPTKVYGISGRKIKYNEIILSIALGRRPIPVIGELKIIHDDILNPKIKIIATKNNMAKEQIIEIDKVNDIIIEENIIEFLKGIFF